MKVFIVLQHDFAADASNAGEFCSPTTIERVCSNKEDAQDFIEKAYGDDDPSEAEYGFEIEEHEIRTA